MIEVKVNIDFNKALKEVEGKKLSENLNKEISPPIAKASFSYIESGKVVTKEGEGLSVNNPREKEGGKPLFDTGALARSLKGSPQGIRGVSYAKEHRKGYKWKGLKVPQREFIVAKIASEKSSVDKIYKDFQTKFVKLLSKRIRKK